MKPQKRPSCVVRLDPQTYTRIKRIAKRQRRTIIEVLRQLAAEAPHRDAPSYTDF